MKFVCWGSSNIIMFLWLALSYIMLFTQKYICTSERSLTAKSYYFSA